MTESVFERDGIAAAVPADEEAYGAPAGTGSEADANNDGGIAGEASNAAAGEAGTATASESEVGADPSLPSQSDGSKDGEDEEVRVDYEQIMREDLAVLKAAFPELAELGDVSELSGALRYAALRDMGLSAVEAYMASSAPRSRRDNRAHLSSAVARGAAAPAGAMTHAELAAARKLFSGMSDAEIHSLYKRVSG